MFKMEFPFKRSTSRDNYNEDGSQKQPLHSLRSSITEGSSQILDSMIGAKNGLFGGISSKFDQVLKRGDSGTGFSVSPEHQGQMQAESPRSKGDPSNSRPVPAPRRSGNTDSVPQGSGDVEVRKKTKPPRPTRGPSVDRGASVDRPSYRPNGTIRRASTDIEGSSEADSQNVNVPGNIAINFDEPLYGKKDGESGDPNVTSPAVAKRPEPRHVMRKRPSLCDDSDMLKQLDSWQEDIARSKSGQPENNQPKPEPAVHASASSMESREQNTAVTRSKSGQRENIPPKIEPVVHAPAPSAGSREKTTVQVEVHPNIKSPDKSILSIDVSNEPASSKHGDNKQSLLGSDLLPGIPRIPSVPGSGLLPGSKDLLAITPTTSEALPEPSIEPTHATEDDSDVESSATEGCDEDMDSPGAYNEYMFRTGSVGSDKSWSSSYSNESQIDELSAECMEFMKAFVQKIFAQSSPISQFEKARFGELCQHGPGRLWFARYVNAQRVNNKKVVEQIFYQLVQYFAIALFECNETEDYTPAKTLMNMCFTFYHEVKNPRGPDMKHYLYSYMKDQPIWQSLRFWNAAFFDAVQNERARKPMVTNSEATEAYSDDRHFQENITFGQLGTFSCNMRAFGLSKELCLEFLRKQSTIANLREEQVQMLKENVERWRD